MGAARQVILGVASLAHFYGLAPVVACRCVLTARDRAQGRTLIRAHLARARRLAGVTLDLRGAENLPASGGFVLVYNQTSLADDMCDLEILWSLGLDLCVIAAEYTLFPFLRAAGECAGIVFLQRGKRAATDRALDQLASAASQGQRLAMAPEGRLSADGEVGHFKRGAFLVAIRARVPVIPMCVQGGREILAPRALRMQPGVQRYRIGQPIPTVEYSDARAPELAEYTRGVVAELYRQARLGRS